MADGNDSARLKVPYLIKLEICCSKDRLLLKMTTWSRTDGEKLIIACLLTHTQEAKDDVVDFGR